MADNKNNNLGVSGQESALENAADAKPSVMEIASKRPKPSDKEEIKASDLLGGGKRDDSFLRVSTALEDGAKVSQGIDLLLRSDAQKNERLPILDVVFDKFVQYFSLSTRNFLQTNIETRNISVSHLTFGDYLDNTTLPALFNIIKVEEWDTTGLITINNSLIYALINILLGGKKNPIQHKEKAECRTFSRLETNLVERFIRSVLDDLHHAFSFLYPIQFHLERQETIPKLIGTVSSGPVSVCSIKLAMGEFDGLIEVVLPHASFDPIRDKLTHKYVGDTFGPSNLWKPYLEKEIQQVELNFSAVLFEETVSLLDVLRWKRGTQLSVDIHKLEEVELRTEDKLLMDGKLGHHNDMVAVEVDNIYLKDNPKSD